MRPGGAQMEADWWWNFSWSPPKRCSMRNTSHPKPKMPMIKGDAGGEGPWGSGRERGSACGGEAGRGGRGAHLR